MTILDKINEAETKAESLKNDARNKVIVLLDENQVKNNELVEQKLKDAKNICITNNQKTKNQLEQLEKTLNKEAESICISDEKKANTHQKDVVLFIMNKVIES